MKRHSCCNELYFFHCCVSVSCLILFALFVNFLQNVISVDIFYDFMFLGVIMIFC